MRRIIYISTFLVLPLLGSCAVFKESDPYTKPKNNNINWEYSDYRRQELDRRFPEWGQYLIYEGKKNSKYTPPKKK